MTILAKRMESVAPSATKAMTALAAKMQAEGRSVITLSQGEPDFDTPPHVSEAGIAAIRAGATRYTAVPGIVPLREAIVKKLQRDHGLCYSIDEIIVSCGAKQVLFNALFATLDPGDEVIVPAPCWVSYPEMVKLAGGVPVVIECGEAHGFKLQPSSLDAAITPRTKWLMLNSPCNPTGAVYTRDDYFLLAEVLHRHPHVWILADDIYEKLIYEGLEFTTPAQVDPRLKARSVIVNGVSKSAAMTGWRVGYGAGPAPLIKAMNTIQGQTTSHTSSISQYAAIEAISGDQTFLRPFLAEYQARRDKIVSLLNAAPGLRCNVPMGAFYVFASCDGLIGSRTSSGEVLKDDNDVAMYLLDEAGVAAVAGSGFLASPYIRLSYAASMADIEIAGARIIAACSKLSFADAQQSLT